MAPTLADAYPLADRGLQLLAALLPRDAEARRAYYAALTADEIAELFLAATEVRRLVEREVRPNLNRETTDRFLVHGRGDVERAVRAHWSEHPARQALTEEMGADAAVRVRPAVWLRERAERDAQAEDAARRAIQAEVEMKTQHLWFQRMWRARRVTNPLPCYADRTSMTVPLPSRPHSEN